MYNEEATEVDLSSLEFPGVPYRAIVNTNVASLADDLMVKIPQLDSDDDPRGLHDHGPCLGWDKRSDGSYPAKGDNALVFVDDTGDYWIAAWSPA